MGRLSTWPRLSASRLTPFFGVAGTRLGRGSDARCWLVCVRSPRAIQSPQYEGLRCMLMLGWEAYPHAPVDADAPPASEPCRGDTLSPGGTHE
jgi:hypothetical protein